MMNEGIGFLWVILLIIFIYVVFAYTLESYASYFWHRQSKKKIEELEGRVEALEAEVDLINDK